MRGTGYLLIAGILALGGSRIALAENISPSESAPRIEWRLPPLFRGGLCALAGDYERAIAVCDEKLRSDPDNIRAHALRGYVYFFKKHHAQQAIADFNAVLCRDPRNAAILIARARAYLQDKNDDRAVADLSEAIRLHPGCSEAYSRRGTIYRVSKHVLGKALADYSIALRLDPGRIATRLARAEVYRSQGESARALADLEMVFRHDPYNELAHYLRGLVYLDQNNLDRARADASELIRLYPKSQSSYALQSQISLVRGEGGKCLFNTVASLFLQPGRIRVQVQPASATTLGGLTFGSENAPPPDPSDAERIVACTKRLRDDPNNVASYYERAGASNRQGDLKRAVADLDEIIRREPGDAEAYHLRGRVLRSRKECEEAIKDFNRAIRLDPDNAEYYLDRGIAYAIQKNAKKALRDYARCLRLDSRYALAHILRGGLYCGRKEYDKAIADHSEALRLCPAYALAYAKRGTAFFFKGEYSRAFADWREDLRLDPGNLKVRSYLAWCLATWPDARLRNGKEAQDLATDACESTSWRDWRQLSVLAAACAECSDFDRAVKWQTKSLELAPETETNNLRWYLDLYRTHKAYHQLPSLAVSASPAAK